MRTLSLLGLMCVALLSSHTAFAATADCVLGKLDQNGKAVPVATIGKVDPADEDSLGSVGLDSTISAACVGLGSEDPGVLCGFVKGTLIGEALKARRSLKATTLLSTGHATGNFADLAITWLNPADNQTHLIACFQ